jgi:hypothetical protein
LAISSTELTEGNSWLSCRHCLSSGGKTGNEYQFHLSVRIVSGNFKVDFFR